MPGKRIRQKSKGEAIPEGKAKPKRKTPKRKSGVSGWAKWRGQKSASKQTAEAATQTETHTAEAAAQTETRTAEATAQTETEISIHTEAGTQTTLPTQAPRSWC